LIRNFYQSDDTDRKKLSIENRVLIGKNYQGGHEKPATRAGQEAKGTGMLCRDGLPRRASMRSVKHGLELVDPDPVDQVVKVGKGTLTGLRKIEGP
jgi:hypothetical protein